jgi:F0F1-type ATP synthase assembly protein I|tara:strand:+ start:179 stop:442 length:264 start_codon:yes stop_codon:yes gene_type:complete
MLGAGDKEQMRQLGKYGAVGIEMGLAVLIGLLLGQYIDNKFDCAPYGENIGLFAGIGAAVKALIRVTRDYQRVLQQKGESARDNNDQ